MQSPAGSPEEVKRKWDSLLGAVNSRNGIAPRAREPAGAAAQGDAQELVAVASSRDRLPPVRRQRPQWDDKHSIVFSVCNDNLSKNVRSYFDRPRELHSNGLRYDPPLKTSWRLQDEPRGKSMSSSLVKSASTPEVRSRSQAVAQPSDNARGWDSRHHVVFAKDNKHYHPAYRSYFERPRALLA